MALLSTYLLLALAGMMVQGHAYAMPNLRPSKTVASIHAMPKHNAISKPARHSYLVAALASPGSNHMAATAWLCNLANPAAMGGVLAGGLHAVTGPDHLAAVLPASVGKSGLYGMRMGAIWGLGHGISATFLGGCAYFLKDKLSQQFAVVERISNLVSSAVGVSLLLIGLLGIKESMEEGVSEGQGEESAAATAGKAQGKGSYGAIMLNGCLHGFSWDGIPSIAPAIAMSSWQSAASYLACYSLGTMIAMSASAGAISALSSRLGQLSGQQDLPRKLSFFSSLFAVCIGLYWMLQAFKIV